MSVVIYFSRKHENFINGEIKQLPIGNTAIVAKKIAEKIGAELIEIFPVQEHPPEYERMVELAMSEKQRKERPKYQNLSVNSETSNAIFLGFPNWCGTFPMIIASFLEDNDFSNKTIYPFCTHEGSAFGNSMTDLKKLCPNSIIKQGLPVRGSRVNKSDKAIDSWLNQYQEYGGM